MYVENSKTIYPTSTVEGTRLTLECVEGTVPEGNNEVFCQRDGTWTKPNLYCRRKLQLQTTQQYQNTFIVNVRELNSARFRYF